MRKADVLKTLGAPTVKEEIWTYRRPMEAPIEVSVRTTDGHTNSGVLASHETRMTFSNNASGGSEAPVAGVGGCTRTPRGGLLIREEVMS